MISNVSPRPWVPGTPVKLCCNSKDIRPISWGGEPIANGSKLHVIDQDVTYIFDAEDRKWCYWSENRGGSSGNNVDPDSIASDSDVDSMLDEFFPN